MKKIRKVITILLVLAVFFGSNNFDNLTIHAQDSERGHYEINGKEYDTNKYIVDGDTYLTVTSCDNPDETLKLNLSDVEKILKSSNKNSNESNENEQIFIAPSIYASVSSSAIQYGRKVYDKLEERHYYCYGFKGATDYLKIGCNYNYRLNLSSLSSTRKSNVDKYINYIDDCNDDFDAAVAAAGAETVAAIVTAGGGAVLLAAVAPEALIIAILAAGFTGTLAAATTAITKLISASGKLNKAADMYDTIKLYGTKL